MSQTTSNPTPAQTYCAPRLKTPVELDGNWSKPAWNNSPVAVLKNFMGKRPSHFPKTEFRVGYDSEAVYLIFRVEDNYVRAVTETEFQGPVCRDSCVEFFFTPGPDIEKGYFNIEMNCGGSLLWHWQTVPRQGRELSADQCAQILKYHQLPRIVEPEITATANWTVEYRVPFSVLEAYTPLAYPAPGVKWRANFYKCADASSHPHWLTWAPVELPNPDFHQPRWFGALEFV